MGSLRSNGQPIIRTNHSYRNIGRAVVVNEVGFSTRIAVDFINEPASLIVHSSYDEPREILNLGHTMKTTSTEGDLLLERQFGLLAANIPAPAIPDEKVQYAVIQQGVAVKITQANADTLIDRNFS